MQGEINELKLEIATLKSSPNDGGDTGDIVGGDDDDDDLCAIEVVWHRSHFECGITGSTPQREKTFIENQMKDHVDFIGLSEFERPEVVIEADDGGGAGNLWNFGMIGAGCSSTGTYIEPIRLYYNTNNWELFESYPSASVCQDPENPPIKPLEDPWNCGSNDVVPNTLSGQCCTCTFSVAEHEANQQNIKDRTWVAGIFKQPLGVRCDGNTICVVATGLPHPKYGPGAETIAREVATFCGNYPIIFMADTNLHQQSEKTSGRFEGIEPLNSLVDHPNSPYTCCLNDEIAGNTKGASDRIATTGNFVIESITGGASTPTGTDYPPGFGYPCAGTASFGEHLPIKAVITCPNNECNNTPTLNAGPIPKTDLKCSNNSDYGVCFDGGVNPTTGFWEFDFDGNHGRPNPACANYNPGSCAQFCDECAGGPALDACSCDGGYLCKPYVA